MAGWRGEKKVGATVKNVQWKRMSPRLSCGRGMQQTAARHANQHLTGTNREGRTRQCQRSETLKTFFFSLNKKSKQNKTFCLTKSHCETGTRQIQSARHLKRISAADVLWCRRSNRRLCNFLFMSFFEICMNSSVS